MGLTNAQLKILLLGANLLTTDQFEDALSKAKQKEIPLDEFLILDGIINEEQLGQVVANYLKISFADLKQEKIQEDALSLIPEVVAKNQNVIAFNNDADNVYVATSKPDNYSFFKLLEKKTGKNVIIYYTSSVSINEALKNYRSDLDKKIKSIILELKKSEGNESKIVELVDVLLSYAQDNRASDIHIEPLDETVLVRFRIDGVLHEVAEYPKVLHQKLVFRLKIMSRLKTDEQSAAQDGRFTFKNESYDFDVRVSILPITDGENIVMRLLSKSSRRLTLDDLGLDEDDREKIKRASEQSYGMIIAAGPTGSGKTTLLYSVLQRLNRPEVNIMTIEDPVEYDVEHVQQTQVNAKKDLTFSTGLRSIVRQDPDIIMVGEIRDNDTADIAVNAAMTGHLVLSTIHANDTATTFPRLIDMGVEPFLIASALNVVIAQRLVRKVCDSCRSSYNLDEDAVKKIQNEKILIEKIKSISGKKDISKVRFYKGAGCKVCGDTGYSGRIGIFEVMEVTEELRTLITQKASSDIIEKKAIELGMKTMTHDGMNKAIQGITTIEEIIRATNRIVFTS